MNKEAKVACRVTCGQRTTGSLRTESPVNHLSLGGFGQDHLWDVLVSLGAHAEVMSL